MITHSLAGDRRDTTVSIRPDRRMIFGGDYNPEQWPESVWPDDVRLMTEAGVTTVTLGVFSWAAIEPADGVFEFGWLDRIMGLLHEAGIGVALATPTAAPPMWLIEQHPEIMTVDESGMPTGRGGRLGWSPSSVVFREHALRMVRALAEHVADHPALVLWHVSNEISNENGHTYDDETAVAFRLWLEARHSTIERLNDAWGTSFWGHTYPDFEHVRPPRSARTHHNPALLLDFERFTSDALLGHYLAEREVLREVTPDVPITTNFMVMRSGGVADYERWAREVDVVSNDHYTMGADPRRHEELSFSAARTRGMAGGGPWLLMEHSTSSVNWQKLNLAKGPDEMLRNSLAHVAHGADGVSFFQWRQSRSGAEQWHSGMVPHAGPESQVFRDVCRLGAVLGRLDRVVGSSVARGDVAIVWDQQSVWALSTSRTPHDDLPFHDLPIAVHAAASRAHLGVDVVPVDDDWSNYPVVVLPNLWLAAEGMTERVDAYVRDGGHLIVTCRSGIVNSDDQVLLGGYPGAYRETLGVRVDEFFPVPGDTVVTAADGGGATWGARHWTERVEATRASVLWRWVDGPRAGEPAVTLNAVGTGEAVHVSTMPDAAGWDALLASLAGRWELRPTVTAPPAVEAVTRRTQDGTDVVFLLNHGDEEARVGLAGHDHVTDAPFKGVVPAGGVAVVATTAEEARA